MFIFIFIEGMIEERRVARAIVVFMLTRADGFHLTLHYSRATRAVELLYNKI